MYIIQKRAVRHILDATYLSPSRPLFVRANLLTIFAINQIELLRMVHKIVFRIILHDFNTETIAERHDHFTRRRSHLQVSGVSSNKAEGFIIFRGFMEFNKLPTHIRSLSDPIVFKRKLREALFDDYC